MTKQIQVPPSIVDSAVFRTLTAIARILNLKVNFSPIPPTSKNSVGEEGMFAHDDGSMYIYTSKNEWKRSRVYPMEEDGTPQSVIFISDASQLSGELSSSKKYIVDGSIDMGTTSIVVPQDGLNISGHGFGISKLYSSEDNFSLFITDGTYSGDLFLTSMDIEITGSLSKVFDLDNLENSNAVEWNTVNFISCTSLGEIAKYRQGLGRNIAWISCDEGLTMSGNWSGGFAIVDVIVVGSPMTGVLFKAGTSLVIGGSFRSNANIIGIGSSGGTFCNFSPSNISSDAGFSLDNVRALPNSGAVPNMPPSSVKALIKNCVGIDNTHQGAALSPDADTTTSIILTNTFYQVSGSMTLEEDFWFSKSNINGIKLDSDQVTEVNVSGTLSFSGTNGREMGIQIRKYDDSASSYADIGPIYKATLNGGGSGTKAENVSFHASTSMSKNDRIEVWIANLTDATDIDTLSGGQIQVFER